MTETRTSAVVSFDTHRAGPVERETWEGDLVDVQRCLRCDRLLRIVAKNRTRRQPIRVGDHVLAENACRVPTGGALLVYDDE